MPLTARSQALLYEPTPLLQPSPRTRSPALGYSQLASIGSIASGSAVISRTTTTRWRARPTRGKVTPCWASPSRWSRGRRRRLERSADAAGADDGVAADLAGALFENEVAPGGEADLGAVAPGAGPVQVEGRRGVGDVFVVDDQEVAGGMFAVGAAVDDPAPLERADDEAGSDVAFDVGDAGHGARGVDGQVVDAVAVLVDLALVAEAVGEGRVVQGCGALEVFDEDVLDDAGVGVGRDRQAQGGGEAEQYEQESSAHAGFLSDGAGRGVLPWLGGRYGLEDGTWRTAAGRGG